MTEKHQLLTDEQFEQKFENCTLAPSLVTSEAHLRLAYIHINKHGIKNAVRILYKQLSEFDTKFGNILTICKSTIKAFVKLMYDFIKKATTGSFRELVLEFPDLKSKFSTLLISSNKTESSTDVSK